MIRYRPTKVLLPATLADSQNDLFGWLLEPTVISWDGGNGLSSAWHIVDGVLYYFTLPNVRVPVTGYDMNAEVTTIGTNELIYADVSSGRFGIGDGIWEQSKYPPETFINSEERYGSEMHIFMLLCLLAALNAPEETPLTIVTSAPPGLVNKVARQIKQNLRNGQAKDKSGVWMIRMSYDKKPRTYVIGKVIVVPEGIGAYSAYAYDANGNSVLIPSQSDVTDDSLTGQVHIHDAGQGTYDTYIIRNGRIDAESMSFATDSDAGVLRQMIEPIMDYVRDQFARSGEKPPKLKAIQVDSWLRQWSIGKMKPECAKVKLNGRWLELHAIFELSRARYARYVIEHKLEPSLQHGADTLLLVGGGWGYILDMIRKQYPYKNILAADKVPHLKAIPMWELNAYGGLPMSAANKRINQKVAQE